MMYKAAQHDCYCKSYPNSLPFDTQLYEHIRSYHSLPPAKDEEVSTPHGQKLLLSFIYATGIPRNVPDPLFP